MVSDRRRCTTQKGPHIIYRTRRSVPPPHTCSNPSTARGGSVGFPIWCGGVSYLIRMHRVSCLYLDVSWCICHVSCVYLYFSLQIRVSWRILSVSEMYHKTWYIPLHPKCDTMYLAVSGRYLEVLHDVSECILYIVQIHQDTREIQRRYFQDTPEIQLWYT